MTFSHAIGGLEIIVSTHATTATDEPVKRLAPKRWMRRRNYHQRVQKKWIKRFGYEREPAAFRVGNKMVIHPSLKLALERHLATKMEEQCWRAFYGEDLTMTPTNPNQQAG